MTHDDTSHAAVPPPDDTATTEAGSRRPSGFEIADKAASGVETAFSVIGLILLKLWALLLIAGAVIVVVLVPSLWWAALLFGGYGLYLLLPGEKWVIW